MVNQEIARSNGEEQGVRTAVDGIQPTGQPDVTVVGPGSGGNTVGVRQQRMPCRTAPYRAMPE